MLVPLFGPFSSLHPTLKPLTSMLSPMQLEVPPVILGYHQPGGKPPSLRVYITLRPRLAAPARAAEPRISGEQADVARYARKWLTGG